MSAQRRATALAGDRLAGRWTHLYTQRLNEATARDRRDEVASDRFEHIAAAQTVGLSAGATSRALAARLLLGVPADLSWRHQHLRAARQAGRKENAMSQSAARGGAHFTATIAGVVVVGWIVVVIVGSTMYSRANDSVNWGAGAFVASLAAVGVLGLVRLARDLPSGAFLLAAAAFGSTFPFFWVPLIPLVGLAFAAGFIAYGRSVKATSDAVSLTPSQT